MSEEWKHASWVSFLGMIAWMVGILSGVISIIVGIVRAALFFFTWGSPIWLIISGVMAIVISFFVILPMFSIKCQKKDWDSLLDWVLPIGNIRFPWMLLWGIILEIFTWWGGICVIIPALVLLFAGPKEYEWKIE
ncbi:MAG: hypothetical protein KGD58_00660 [Candidatus Lokiarchaeota archaeon]|nr:hypothetical protein [Candidatus Lokiarchaeota archaeon]